MPPDHLVPGLVVAGNENPAEIDLIPFLDLVSHIHGLGLFLWHGFMQGIGIGKPFIITHLNQVIDVFDHRFSAEVLLLTDL